MMITSQPPAWVCDLLSLNTDPTAPTLVLVPHDGGQISFPALPLLAASSSLAQLVTENMMDYPNRSTIIHLPASWDALIILKELVLTGFTASDGVIYTATSEDVFDLINLLGIEGIRTKEVYQTNLNGNRGVEICENIVKSGNFVTVSNETNENILLSENEHDEIIPEASSKKNYEVPTEEDDPEMDEGLGEYERVRRRNIREKEKLFASLDFPAAKSALTRSAGQNSCKWKAAAQTCLAPPAQRTRRSTRPTAAAAQGGRFEKESLGSSIIDEHDKRKSNKTNNKKTVTAAKALHKDTQFHCDLCPAQFRIMRSVKRHKKAVHEGVKYSCDLCPFEGSQMGHVKRHKKAVHEGVKYSCDLCPFEGSQMGHVKRHKKAVHEGVKYSCDLCSRQFTSAQNLKQHKKSVHEGLKYSCNLCPAQFFTPNGVTKHKKRVHEGSKY